MEKRWTRWRLSRPGHDEPQDSWRDRPILRPPGISVQLSTCRGAARPPAPAVVKIVSSVT